MSRHGIDQNPADVSTTQEGSALAIANVTGMVRGWYRLCRSSLISCSWSLGGIRLRVPRTLQDVELKLADFRDQGCRRENAINAGRNGFEHLKNVIF